MNKICNILLIKHSFWLYNHFYIIVTCHKNNFPFTFLLLHVEITTTISVIVERKKMAPPRGGCYSSGTGSQCPSDEYCPFPYQLMDIERNEADIDAMRLQAMVYA